MAAPVPPSSQTQTTTPPPPPPVALWDAANGQTVQMWENTQVEQVAMQTFPTLPPEMIQPILHNYCDFYARRSVSMLHCGDWREFSLNHAREVIDQQVVQLIDDLTLANPKISSKQLNAFKEPYLPLPLQKDMLLGQILAILKPEDQELIQSLEQMRKECENNEQNWGEFLSTLISLLDPDKYGKQIAGMVKKQNAWQTKMDSSPFRVTHFLETAFSLAHLIDTETTAANDFKQSSNQDWHDLEATMPHTSDLSQEVFAFLHNKDKSLLRFGKELLKWGSPERLSSALAKTPHVVAHVMIEHLVKTGRLKEAVAIFNEGGSSFEIVDPVEKSCMTRFGGQPVLRSPLDREGCLPTKAEAFLTIIKGFILQKRFDKADAFVSRGWLALRDCYAPRFVEPEHPALDQAHLLIIEGLVAANLQSQAVLQANKIIGDVARTQADQILNTHKLG